MVDLGRKRYWQMAHPVKDGSHSIIPQIDQSTSIFLLKSPSCYRYSTDAKWVGHLFVLCVYLSTTYIVPSKIIKTQINLFNTVARWLVDILMSR